METLRFIVTQGIRLHCAVAGHPEAPTVILLHGFPEYWRSWRHQIPALAAHFQVVAPDLRGYHLSDKPETGYDLATLVEDVRGLIGALGSERVHLVGHDWGGAIAWALGHRYPELLNTLTILNGPHPVRYGQVALTNPGQTLKSWYILFFQLPILPEVLLAANDYAFITSAFSHPSVRPGTFSAADLEDYRRAIALPGALNRALAYYRQARTIAGLQDWFRNPIPVPTQVIWGMRDFALEPAQIEGLQNYVAGTLQVERLANASHWIQQEEPEAVNRLLLDFLRPQS